MRVTITRNTSKNRRQRWTVSLAPVSRDEDLITFILDEYAVEVQEQGRWARPKLTFYRRRGGADAAMPLEEVPRLDDEARGLLMNQLWKQVRLVSQSPRGIQPL